MIEWISSGTAYCLPSLPCAAFQFASPKSLDLIPAAASSSGAMGLNTFCEMPSGMRDS